MANLCFTGDESDGDSLVYKHKRVGSHASSEHGSTRSGSAMTSATDIPEQFESLKLRKDLMEQGIHM